MTCRSKTSQSVLLNWLKVGAAVPNNLVTHLVPVSTANKVRRCGQIGMRSSTRSHGGAQVNGPCTAGFLALNFFGS